MKEERRIGGVHNTHVKCIDVEGKENRRCTHDKYIDEGGKENRRCTHVKYIDEGGK